MEMPNRSQSGKQGENSRRSPLAFRFRRPQPVKGSTSSPFTELPEELKGSRMSFGRFFRGVLNTVLLLSLGLALLALIGAFAYQLINDPQALAETCYSLIRSVEGLFQQLTAAQ